ncbi:sulfurtransferase-like selenium metabolism protein YedF [Thermosulfurimonas marina]|nr:sulfurtransferase-like selenium metabolism protein YedF [Thermosulfurimonas marina]
MVEKDCRGLACPQPVLETKEALEGLREGEVLRVLVDNEAAVKNVSRFAETQGHRVEAFKEGDYFVVEIEKRGAGVPVGEISCERPEGEYWAILFPSDRIGDAEPELGCRLVASFFKGLREMQPKPQVILFYTKGVFLLTEDSPVLEDLQHLEKEGVEILACGTCVEYYGLGDRLRVGKLTNMYEAMLTLGRATKIIRL